MTYTYLTGWVADVRKRVPFIAPTATVICTSDPEVHVVNHMGHFFSPHLQVKKIYTFLVRNGSFSRRIRVVLRPGHNETGIILRTKDPVSKPSKPKPRIKYRFSKQPTKI
jgi:hypothetical protein